MSHSVASRGPQGRYRSEDLCPDDDVLDDRPPLSYTQHFGGILAHPSKISDRREGHCAWVPLWAIEREVHDAFRTWLKYDATKVDRSILLDLLKICVYRDKSKAELMLKGNIKPPLDVSIVLGDCVRDMHRPQIETKIDTKSVT